jgi:hypothetical protein
VPGRPTARRCSPPGRIRCRTPRTGRGKWLLRELRDLDDSLATRWLACDGVPETIVALAEDVLRPVGGRLFDGHRMDGERPAGDSVGGLR